MRPLLLDDLDEDDVELGGEEAVLPAAAAVGLLRRAARNHQVDDEALDAVALLGRERLPSILDGILQDLQREELGVAVGLARLEDEIDAEPVEG